MVKHVALSKTILLHGYILISWQNLSISWLNLYLLAKPFYFMAKLPPIGKTFLLHD
jgi:hypothetical protein